MDEADTDQSGDLSQAELEAMTVKQIKALAKELGYTITATTKAEIIEQFLTEQG